MLVQCIVNGLLAGVVIATLGTAFAVLYSAGRFFVFTFGASFAWAAYVMLLLDAYVPRAVAVAGGVAAGCALGVALEVFLYGRIRRRGGGPLILMLASIGAYAVLQNLICIFFGDETRSLRDWMVTEGHRVLGAHVSDVQLIIAGTSIAALVVTWLLLEHTSLGRQLRAVANDELLARVVGIEVDRVVAFGVAIGSGLAAIAGVLMSFDTDLIPTMGFQALLLGVVGAIVGGITSIRGAMVGGLFVGLAQHIGVWKIPTQWQDAIVFAILIVFLILRPQGFFGKPIRAASV